MSHSFRAEVVDKPGQPAMKLTRYCEKLEGGNRVRCRLSRKEDIKTIGGAIH